MKIHIKLLLIIYIIGLFTVFIPTSVKAFDDIDFEFQRDLLFESDNIEFIEQFNVRDSGSSEGNFPATYSFTDDPVGDNNPIGWTTTETGTSDVRILSDLFGHSKVVEIEGGSSGLARIENFPNPKPTFGIIEYWITTANRGKRSEFNLIDNDITFITVFIDNNRIEYFDGDLGTQVLGNIENNIWYHIRIEFECSGSAFLGLAQFHFNLYLNGVLGDTDILFKSSRTELDTVQITSIPPEGIYITRYDAIGFSWEGYQKGDNVIAELELDGFKEVDKYEFALSEPDTLRTIGSSNYGTWTESDSGGHDNVNIQADSNDDNNRVIEISTNNAGDVKGIRKNNFTSTSDLIEITMSFEFTDFSGSTSYNIIVIDSSDSDVIAGFQFKHDGTLNWFDDINSSGIELRDDLTTGIIYNLSVILDYTSDTFLLRWYIDGIFETFYTQDLIENGKNGLKDIFIRSHWVDNIATMLVYNIGVYENEVSESKELAWITVKTGDDNWNSANHYLFQIVANGFIKFGMTRIPYDIDAGTPYTDDTSVFEQHTGGTITFNTGSDIFRIFTTPQAIFYFLDNEFNVLEISIEGSKLVEGVNEYFLEFESSGIDDTESFFFVDTNNKLQFLHHSEGDSELEFIQAKFNINNRSSNDIIVSFTTIIDNNAFGFFRINFNDTSQLIPIENIQKTKRVILITDLTLDSFIILVTDTNNPSVSGLTTGFVSDIIISDVNEAIISISTLNLIEMIVPLILILFPTFILSLISRKFIVPLFVLMSVILTISSIIPIWLFFIIALSCSMFIFFDNESSQRDDF